MYPNDIEKYQAFTKAADWKAIAELNGGFSDTFGVKKEFGVLPNYLEENEIVLALAAGMVTQSDTSNSTDWGSNTWLVVLTNERFLFLDHAMLTKSVDTQSVRLDRVQAVSSSQGFLLGKITVDLSARVIVIDNCQKKDVKAMAEIANKLLRDREQQASVKQNAAAAPAIDYADQLTKFAQLRDAGVLSDEEFAEAKRKVIAAM